MMTNLIELIILLPVVVVGITLLIIMLSVAHNRNQYVHAILTVFGLISSIVCVGIIWICNIHDDHQLIYINNFSIICIILMLFSSLATSILAYKWLLNYPNARRDEFYLLLLLSTIGGILLISANHLIVLFLGIELISLPLFGLIGYAYFQKFSVEVTIKYIVLSGVSSSFLLFGMALIYISTGCLSFHEISQILINSGNNMYLFNSMFMLIGLGMMLVGFGFKLSFVPFHIWVPDIYQGAPILVSMYLATGVKVAIISALIRFFLIFPDQYSQIFYMLLSSIAFCSMLFGNLMAIGQNSIRRVLACSSITNIGYILVAIIASRINFMAFEAISIYLISYVLSNIGIFGIISIFSFYLKKDIDLIWLYKGLFWRQPTLSIMLTIIILSLAGIPMTFGFIGKFYLFMLGINTQLWWLIIVMLVSSIIGVFFYLKIMINLYLSVANNSCLLDLTDTKYLFFDWIITPQGMLIMIISIVILLLGLYPQCIVQLIHFINLGY